eukprot:214979-Prymnesium_polylepis.1
MPAGETSGKEKASAKEAQAEMLKRLSTMKSTFSQEEKDKAKEERDLLKVKSKARQDMVKAKQNKIQAAAEASFGKLASAASMVPLLAEPVELPSKLKSRRSLAAMMGRGDKAAVVAAAPAAAASAPAAAPAKGEDDEPFDGLEATRLGQVWVDQIKTSQKRAAHNMYELVKLRDLAAEAAAKLELKPPPPSAASAVAGEAVHKLCSFLPRPSSMLSGKKEIIAQQASDPTTCGPVVKTFHHVLQASVGASPFARSLFVRMAATLQVGTRLLLIIHQCPKDMLAAIKGLKGMEGFEAAVGNKQVSLEMVKTCWSSQVKMCRKNVSRAMRSSSQAPVCGALLT